MCNRLQNKKVLLIMPFYFMYQNTISTALENRGAEVFLINQNIEEEILGYRFARIYYPKLARKIENYFYSKKNDQIPKDIDYVVVIKGSTINQVVLSNLKKKYSESIYILYQWDSVNNYRYAKELADYFDYKYTFDYEDANRYGWNYRPLFFDPAMCNFDKPKEYDISFVASLHSERYKILRLLRDFSNKENLRLFDYLYSNPLSLIRQKYIKRNKSFEVNTKDIKFVPLSISEVHNIYDCSKCVMDYKYDGQDGLTIRTIESLGHECKLITNNASIKREPFYNEHNILVYDIEKLDIPHEFIESDYIKIPDEIIRLYTIDGWIDDVFGGNQ